MDAPQTVTIRGDSTNPAEVVAGEIAARRGEWVDNGVSLLMQFKVPGWLEATAGLPPAAIRSYVRQQLAGPECADFRRPSGAPPAAVPGQPAKPQLGRLGEQIAAAMRGRSGYGGPSSGGAPGLAGDYR